MEKLIMWVVASMVCLALTITPSSSRDENNCWGQMADCHKGTKKQSLTSPTLNPLSPWFDKSEYFCCPLFKQLSFNQKECICAIIPLLNEKNDTDIRKIFHEICNVTEEGLTIDAFCEAPTPPPPSPPPQPVNTTPVSGSLPPSTPEGKNSTVGAAIGAALGTVLLLTAISVGFCCWKKKKHEQVAGYGTVREHGTRNLQGNSNALINDMIKPISLHYEFEALKVATNNFSYEGKLGHGGFGAVYKGVLQNGEEVAVKRLSKGSGQGDKEFKSEVEFVAKLKHNNLVRLMGFCLANEERLLVYEFMLNKSLDYFLFDSEKQQILNWPKRSNIIGGVGRGILYLHEDSPTRIIHCDLKAANVLLDKDMNPKIADFGLAKSFKQEQTQAHATEIAGTCGYMAPEFLKHGKYSVKSDVYAFGVLILEIISGKKVSTVIHRREGGDNLLSYAWRCLRDGVAMEFMDPTLKDSCAEDEIVRSIHMGLLCLQEDPKRRPQMAKLVHLFNSDVDANSLPLPTYPAFSFGTNYG